MWSRLILRVEYWSLRHLRHSYRPCVISFDACIMLIWLCLVLIVHRMYVILFHPLIMFESISFLSFSQSVCDFRCRNIVDLTPPRSLYLYRSYVFYSIVRSDSTASHCSYKNYLIFFNPWTMFIWLCCIIAVPTVRMWSHLIPYSVELTLPCFHCFSQMVCASDLFWMPTHNADVTLPSSPQIPQIVCDLFHYLQNVDLTVPFSRCSNRMYVILFDPWKMLIWLPRQSSLLQQEVCDHI